MGNQTVNGPHWLPYGKGLEQLEMMTECYFLGELSLYFILFLSENLDFRRLETQYNSSFI